jgi:hypothetical protein
MKAGTRAAAIFILALVFGTGCSVLPGLRVLTGQENPAALDEQLIEVTDLVMADKSGNSDPSLFAAADRIEAASGLVDVIEIRKDLTQEVFTVFVLLQPMDPNTTQAQFINEIRRTIELSWQGTMRESEGSDVLKVVILDPGVIPTLDNGNSFVGIVTIDSQIARDDAIVYLEQRPHTVNDFVDLVSQGTLTLVNPEQLEIYDGQPNHPVFMLSALAAASAQ